MTKFFLIFTIITIVACSKTNYKYNTDYDGHQFPAVIYVEDQILSLNTNGDLPLNVNKYVEVTKKNGNVISGRLINIDYATVKISDGYELEKPGLIQTKKEHTIDLSKKDLLILKIWEQN